MRRVVGVGALLLLCVVGSSPAVAAGKNVTMHDNVFDPATVTIDVNDDVFWCNPSDQDHNVRADDGSFIKDFPKHSGCSGRTFQTAGRFPYHCTLVPSMRGTVIVGSAPSPPPPPPPPPASATTLRPVTTTRPAARPSTTVRGVVTATQPTLATAEAPAIEPAPDATTTTTNAAQVAINERAPGSNRGSVLAIIATVLMTGLGGGYFLYRLRTRP